MLLISFYYVEALRKCKEARELRDYKRGVLKSRLRFVE